MPSSPARSGSADGGPAGEGSGTAAESGTAGTVDVENFAGPACSAQQPFLCYRAKPTKGSAKFSPVDLAIADAIGASDTRVTRPAALCNPAGQMVIPFPDDHFASHATTETPKHTPVSQLVTTPFGALQIDTVKPDRLLSPAAKGLESPPAALAFEHFDSYKCYKAKLAKGLTVDVTDRFSEIRTLSVKKVSRLCFPVAVDGVEPHDPNRLLTCFSVAPAKGEPKHVKRLGVHLLDDLGSEQLDTLKEEEYCAPSSLPPV